MTLKKYKLGDLLNVTRGASLAGEYYSEEGTLKRLTLGHFDYKSNCFKENTSKTDIYYTGPVREEFILKKGDIITPLTEQTPGLLGNTARIPESGVYIQSQDIGLITCNEDLLDPSFAYYLIASPIVKKQLGAGAQQTKIRHTNPTLIKDSIVFIPELSEQRKIGRLLDNISKAISLNRLANLELESIAKQLYDYWFVQFDFPDENGHPYKSSGGKMVWNETLKRNIPERWDTPILNEWLEIKSGFSFSSDDYLKSGKYRIVTIKNVQQGNLDLSNCDYIDHVPAKCKEWCKLKEGDQLISLTGNCGRLCVVTCDGLLLNQRVGLISCDDIYKNYAYFLLLSQEMQMIISHLANGAAQANLSPVDLCKCPAVIPDIKTILSFNKFIEPIKAQFILLNKEIANLLKFRDELLPLLMNGQVIVE